MATAGASPGQQEGYGALLERLDQGFAQRRRLADDPIGARALDAALVRLIDQLASRAGVDPSNGAAPSMPPRDAAMCLVAALHGQPHLGATLFLMERRSTQGLPLPLAPMPPDPIFPPNEVLETAFGLPAWQLDDLREEVDRRAGWLVKQGIVLSWLWARAGLATDGDSQPEAIARLYRMLAPGGTPTTDQPGFIQDGPLLFMVTNQPVPPPPLCGELPWLADDASGGATSFRAAHVDSALRRALARGTGLSPDEVDQLLEQALASAPRHAPTPALDLARWRSVGFAVIADCEARPGLAAALSAPLAPSDVPVRLYFHRSATGLVVPDPLRLLQELAAPRIAALMRRLYAAVIAVAAADNSLARPPVATAVFDLRAHLSAVLQPLLAWASAPATARHLADLYGVPESDAATMLATLRAEWADRIARWNPDRAPASGTHLRQLLTLRLLAFDGHLRRVLRARPAGPDHRVLALLYASFAVARADLDQVLTDSPSLAGGPEDLVGRWFLAGWNHLMAILDDESATTGHIFLDDL